MVALAKLNTHESFVKFLNQALRKASLLPLKPQKNLGLRYSVTDYFANRLVECYGEEGAEKILRLTLEKGVVMVRFRREVDPNITLIAPNIGIIDKESLHIAERDDVYIQNGTPIILYEFLKKTTNNPKSILDLCASPGGKLILAHDFYPTASLVGNDISEKKLDRLKKNLDRLHIKAELNLMRGEEFPINQQYDLILIDAPCSNTGVLHKKPEARWRLSKKEIATQVLLQKKLLERAKDLLSINGQIWYTTCSILPEENEEIVEFAKNNLKLSCLSQKLQLQNSDGYDGGFGASLTKLQ